VRGGPAPKLGRCAWAGAEGPKPDPLMVAYHDDEWGQPATDDIELFERLVLESFQAGLSWSTILHKRAAFRSAFRGFDPALVAAFGEADRERLMADSGIVRNRAKVEATVGNARAWLEIGRQLGGVDRYLRTIVTEPARPLPPNTTIGQIPSTTRTAQALSKDLQARGFRFVGPTIMYAFMQSVGLVDDHLPGCFRYRG
jgi:DNA-3-methyladenine glycosylase I